MLQYSYMSQLERDLAITNIEANGNGGVDCVHHWIIETPIGATSAGVCKRCGDTRRFPNALEDTLLDPSKGHHKARYMARLASMSLDTGDPGQIDLHKSLLRAVKL